MSQADVPFVNGGERWRLLKCNNFEEKFKVGIWEVFFEN